MYVKIDSDGKERIAYDVKNGKRYNKIDDDGNYIINNVSEDKIKELEVEAQIILDKTSEGDFTTFDSLISDDEAYPNGYYVTKTVGESAKEVIDAVFDMKIGEVRLVASDYGVHIVMRYDLEADGYKKQANSDIFIDTQTGNYVFMNELKNQLLTTLVAPYKSKIIVDEKVLATADMKSIEPNFYYY